MSYRCIADSVAVIIVRPRAGAEASQQSHQDGAADAGAPRARLHQAPVVACHRSPH